MRQSVLLLAMSAIMLGPAPLAGKFPTSRITIEGADLTAPIEITDPNLLKDFRIWAGPATTSSDAQSLIVDWSQGKVAEPPKELPRYQISFYAKLPDEQLEYQVTYVHDPTTKQGFVYLPGRGEDGYSRNVFTILHYVEGNWFRAWSLWDNLAGPLINKAKKTVSNRASMDFTPFR